MALHGLLLSVFSSRGEHRSSGSTAPHSTLVFCEFVMTTVRTANGRPYIFYWSNGKEPPQMRRLLFGF